MPACVFDQSFWCSSLPLVSRWLSQGGLQDHSPRHAVYVLFTFLC